jgi:hypothetical protein
MEPELIICGEPIDYELSEILGEKPGEFLVLHLNGVRFERFGTPYNTLRNRSEWDEFVKCLNSKSKKSLWFDLWDNWGNEIRRQFDLPEDATAQDFRPVASYKISRVVPGRSKYLHAAIQLFEEAGTRVKSWSVVRQITRNNLVTCLTYDNVVISEEGSDLPMAICKAVLRALKSSPSNND